MEKNYSDEDLEDEALPFSGDAIIEYGSLGAYPPYVPSPPTALKHAVDLSFKHG